MHRRIRNAAILVLVCLLITGIVWVFSVSVNNLSQDQLLEDKQLLEQALVKACVACYAAEGCYPPSLEYLQTYYGVQMNTEVFTVKYKIIASNLMPDITVLVN